MVLSRILARTAFIIRPACTRKETSGPDANLVDEEGVGISEYINSLFPNENILSQDFTGNVNL